MRCTFPRINILVCSSTEWAGPSVLVRFGYRKRTAWLSLGCPLSRTCSQGSPAAVLRAALGKGPRGKGLMSLANCQGGPEEACQEQHEPSDDGSPGRHLITVPLSQRPPAKLHPGSCSRETEMMNACCFKPPSLESSDTQQGPAAMLSTNTAPHSGPDKNSSGFSSLPGREGNGVKLLTL